MTKMMDLSKLSDEEFYAYAAKTGEEMDMAHQARVELDLRHMVASLKIQALLIASTLVGSNDPDSKDVIAWARWAYKEATGEDWPAPRYTPHCLV